MTRLILGPCPCLHCGRLLVWGDGWLTISGGRAFIRCWWDRDGITRHRCLP